MLKSSASKSKVYSNNKIVKSSYKSSKSKPFGNAKDEIQNNLLKTRVNPPVWKNKNSNQEQNCYSKQIKVPKSSKKPTVKRTKANKDKLEYQESPDFESSMYKSYDSVSNSRNY
jgi:hypothetical protein